MENKEKSKLQKEIVEEVVAKGAHGLLNLAPRVGKTKIAIDIIKKEKPKRVLWVTPSADLRDIAIPQEFVDWRAKTYLSKTDIICWASLSSQRGHYDMIILDEYQDITDGNARPLTSGLLTANKIIGLSGTHPKHEEKQLIYDSLNLGILVSMSIDEAESMGLIADYRIKVVFCDLDDTQKTIKAGNKANPFQITEKAAYDYITKQINIQHFSKRPVPQYMYIRRLRQIYDSKSKLEAAKKLINSLQGRTLIFGASIAQTEALSENTYNSKTDNTALLKFQGKEIDTLACVNSGGVGYTFRDIDNLVIIQVNSDKKGDSTQKLARSLVLQEGYTANIYILCLQGTVDEKWTTAMLEGFNPNKVSYDLIRNYE